MFHGIMNIIHEYDLLPFVVMQVAKKEKFIE